MYVLWRERDFLSQDFVYNAYRQLTVPCSEFLQFQFDLAFEVDFVWMSMVWWSCHTIYWGVVHMENYLSASAVLFWVLFALIPKIMLILEQSLQIVVFNKTNWMWWNQQKDKKTNTHTPLGKQASCLRGFAFGVALFHKGGSRVGASEWLVGGENVNLRAVNGVPQINRDHSLCSNLQEAHLLQHRLKVLSKYDWDSVPKCDSHPQSLNLWEWPTNFKHIPCWSHYPRVRKPMQEKWKTCLLGNFSSKPVPKWLPRQRLIFLRNDECS